jgi:hypothetical protein
VTCAGTVLFFPADHDPPLRHKYQFNLDGAAGQESLNRMLAFLRGIPGSDRGDARRRAPR